MHVISFKRLREAFTRHPDAEGPLREWFKAITKSDFHSFQDLTNAFGGSKIDKVGDIYIFDIGGNKYRLMVGIDFTRQKVYVKEVRTHAEYSKKKFR